MEKTRNKKSFASKIAPYVLGTLPFLAGAIAPFLDEDKQYSFTDTEKPNAVYVVPDYDPSGAFSSKADGELLSKIYSNYDVNFDKISSEKDLYNLMKETPNLELLVIGGHGDGKRISFGDSQEIARDFYDKFSKKYEEGKLSQKEIDSLENAEKRSYEETFLDSKDLELSPLIKKMSPNATVFLKSCEGGISEYSLAKDIKKMAREDIKVISSKEDFSGDQINVKSLYPFRISIDKEAKDIYGNEGKIDISQEY